MSIKVTGPLAPKNDAFDGIVSSKDLAHTVDARVAADKTTPVSGDKFLMFDSADSNKPKLVDRDNLPGGSGGVTDAVYVPIGTTYPGLLAGVANQKEANDVLDSLNIPKLKLLDYITDSATKAKIIENTVDVTDPAETDLKTYIAALVADIPTSGAHILVQSGTYMTSEGFLVASKDNVVLEFEGGARLFQHPSTPANSTTGQHVFINGAGQPCWAYKFYLCNRVEVISPYLDGNWLNVDVECWKRPFIFDRCDNVRVSAPKYHNFKYGGDFRDCTNSGDYMAEFGQNWYGKVVDNGHIYKTEGLGTGTTSDFATGFPYADATSWQWSNDLCIHFIVAVNSTSPDTYKFAEVHYQMFYADSATRVAATPDASLVGYNAFQEDTGEVYELISVSPTVWSAADVITWDDNTGAGYTIEITPTVSQMPGTSGGGGNYPKLSWASGYTAVSTDRWYFQWREDRVGTCNFISNIDARKVWGIDCPQFGNYRLNCWTIDGFVDGGLGGVEHQRDFSFDNNRLGSGVQFRLCHNLGIRHNSFVDCIENCVDIETSSGVTVDDNYFENFEWAAVIYSRLDNLPAATTDHVAKDIKITNNRIVSNCPRTTYSSYTDGHSSAISIGQSGAVLGVSDVDILDNIIIDDQVTPSTLYGVQRSGIQALANVNIDRNKISGMSVSKYSQEIRHFVNSSGSVNTDDVTLYVDPTGTKDGTGPGTDAVTTVQELIDIFSQKNIIHSNIIINVTGALSEDITIAGLNFAAGKSLKIVGNLTEILPQFTNTANGVYTYLEDSTATWTINAYQNLLLKITGGTNSGKSVTVKSNTATAVEFSGATGAVPNDLTTQATVYDWATTITGSITIDAGQTNIILEDLKVVGDVYGSEQSLYVLNDVFISSGSVIIEKLSVCTINNIRLYNSYILSSFGSYIDLYTPHGVNDTSTTTPIINAVDLSSVRIVNGFNLIGNGTNTIGMRARRKGAIRLSGEGLDSTNISACAIGITTDFDGSIQTSPGDFSAVTFSSNIADTYLSTAYPDTLNIAGDIVQVGTHEATSYQGDLLDSTGATLVNNTAKTFAGNSSTSTTASVATALTVTASSDPYYHAIALAYPASAGDKNIVLSPAIYNPSTQDLKISSITVSATQISGSELLALYGVTSAIQTQLNAKSALRTIIAARLQSDFYFTCSTGTDWKTICKANNEDTSIGTVRCWEDTARLKSSDINYDPDTGEYEVPAGTYLAVASMSMLMGSSPGVAMARILVGSTGTSTGTATELRGRDTGTASNYTDVGGEDIIVVGASPNNFVKLQVLDTGATDTVQVNNQSLQFRLERLDNQIA